MKFTWHIIRHDLQRCRWALLCWGTALGYLLWRSGQRNGPGNLNDYLLLAALLAVVILSVGLIADFVQSDHPMRDDAHWRTLPVSAGRMVGAKLVLVISLFVILPLGLAGLKSAMRDLSFLRYFSEYGTAALILSSLSLSLMAVAACTKNVVQALLLWLALYFGTLVLADYLSAFGPKVGGHLAARVGTETIIVCLSLSTVLAAAVTANQYLRRRLAVSVALLLVCAVGTAMLGAFYGYIYFYEA